MRNFTQIPMFQFRVVDFYLYFQHHKNPLEVQHLIAAVLSFHCNRNYLNVPRF